jgi:cytosine/adenosine deaminase-related metal-dependent hydrolase
MPTLLVKNAAVLVTMDDTRREIAGGGLYARDGVIEQIGPTEQLPRSADEVIDATDQIVIPGLVNTHHHIFQNLTRVVPAGQDSLLFGWLKACYPIWRHLSPDHIRVSTIVGLAELALSGCTTSSDHLYLFPNGSRLDDEIDGARAIGLRFHAMRGSMSIGESKGGLPPDYLVEDEDFVLKDCERVVQRYHDPRPFAMLRVGIAPCTPFTVSQDLMRACAEMARRLGVGLHTHTAENEEDVVYCLEHFGMRPCEYAENLGWTGPDTWHAHCVKLDDAEVAMFARTGSGVAHCPTSNMRLGSGIARVRYMLDKGVNIGLGVDGSASNDCADLLAESRQAMLLQRVGGNAAALSAREALALATRGGAAVLGRAREIGQLTPGFAADLATYDATGIQMAGAQWDLVAGLVFCGPHRARHTIVNGRAVVRDFEIATLDLSAALENHARLARSLIEK